MAGTRNTDGTEAPYKLRERAERVRHLALSISSERDSNHLNEYAAELEAEAAQAEQQLAANDDKTPGKRE